MRFVFLALLSLSILSCTQESKSPPVIEIDLTTVDPEAGAIISATQLHASTSADWLELAKYYHAHELLEAAIQAYEYSLHLKNRSETRYLLGVAYAHVGRYDQAIQTLSTIHEYSPARWRQGYWELDLGNVHSAKNHFKAALELNQNEVAAIVGLSRAYLSSDEPQNTIATLDDLIKRGGKHPYVLYLLGKAHQQVGNNTLAKELLGNSTSGQPKWEDPWLDGMKSFQRGFAAELNTAIALIDSGNLQEAELALKQISSKYQYAPEVQSNLGTVQLQLGNPEIAIRTLGNAIRKTPDYAPLKLTMAFALSNVGELSKAQVAASEALELQPSMFAASTFLGKIALQQKEYPTALLHFEKSIQLGDSDPRTRELLAELLLRKGNFEKARQQYTIVLQQSPSRTGSIGGLSISLLNLKKADEANVLLVNALKKFPNDPNLLQALNLVQQSRTK